MNYRRFGRTELTVSEVGFGCARLGGIFPGASKSDMLHTLGNAFDAGITFFDTADMYCQGESEQLLGEAFRGKRDQVVIASKVGYCLPTQRKLASRVKPILKPLIRRIGLTRQSLPLGFSGSLSQNFSSDYMIKSVEQSLRRLKTDYLDLYQLHSPPTSVLEHGEFIGTLEKLKRQGKIRCYGVSCETANDALVCLRYPGISALQVGLSLLGQEILEQVVPQAAAQGMALIARECFAGGLLTRPMDALRLEEFIPSEEARDAKRRELTKYQRIADRHRRPLVETALQFVLSVDGLAVTLLGMRTAEHLRDNLRHLAAARLDADELGELRDAGRTGVEWQSQASSLA